MKIDNATLDSELNIMLNARISKNQDYLEELLRNSSNYNPQILRLFMSLIACDYENAHEFIIGFCFAMKLVDEQIKIDQENELERMMNLY